MQASTAATPQGVAIDAATRSDPRAMERAFDRCSAALYRYVAVRVGDPHLADDLMQQLWIQTRRGAGGVPLDQLEYWLRAVARNLIRSHWRQQHRRPPHIPVHDRRLSAALGERLATEAIPAAELEREEIRHELLLAITELSTDDQELIEGFYFRGCSQAEMAERFGVSERAIEGRLYRARQALRERLSQGQ